MKKLKWLLSVLLLCVLLLTSCNGNNSDGPIDDTPPKVYVGSINSDKYHYPTCTWAKQILPANEVWFSSVADARSKDYVPCKVCKPPSQ